MLNYCIGRLNLNISNNPMKGRDESMLSIKSLLFIYQQVVKKTFSLRIFDIFCQQPYECFSSLKMLSFIGKIQLQKLPLRSTSAANTKINNVVPEANSLGFSQVVVSPVWQLSGIDSFIQNKEQRLLLGDAKKSTRAKVKYCVPCLQWSVRL